MSTIPSTHFGTVQPPGRWAFLPNFEMTGQVLPSPRKHVLLDHRVCSLDPSEVSVAIKSLYIDELKPYGRILRKRLAERAQASGAAAVDVDIKRLRVVCESCPWLCVRTEEGGDWSALIHGRSDIFIDVYSPKNVYPPELWCAAAQYFESLPESAMQLPGGRYSCAQELISRSLPFLMGRSLGQVSHIVQLAISQKKLLGYLSGAVVPYGRSQSMVKERCAERGRPCTSAARGTTAVASWDLVRACLREILDTAAQGPGSIPLSNVKRLFRSRFHLELSETALGHSKLSELLQDDRLSEVCAVRLQGHGYVVVPLQVPSSTIRLADALLPADESVKLETVAEEELLASCDTHKTPEASAWPLSLSLSRCTVRHTFIHATPPSVGASRRASSLPKDTGSGKSDAEWMFCASVQQSSCSAVHNDRVNGRLRERTQSDFVGTKNEKGAINEVVVHQSLSGESDCKESSASESGDDTGPLFYAGGELEGSLTSFECADCPWGPTPDGSFVFADEGDLPENMESNWPKLAPVQLATSLATLSEELAVRTSAPVTSQHPRSRSVGRADLKTKLCKDLKFEY